MLERTEAWLACFETNGLTSMKLCGNKHGFSSAFECIIEKTSMDSGESLVKVDLFP